MKGSQIAPRSNALPRFSSNELAKYVFSSPSARIKKIKEQKFGDQKRAYYTRALNGILKSFLPNTGSFEVDLLRSAERRVRSIPADTKSKADKLSGNAEMLKRFSELCSDVHLVNGHHEVIRRGASLLIRGVEVSVRPEIVSINANDRSVALTKLYFSMDNMSADVADVALLILLRYGESINKLGGGLDMEHTRLIDCYARRVVRGHDVPAIRSRQLDQAIEEIGKIWPKVSTASSASDFF